MTGGSLGAFLCLKGKDGKKNKKTLRRFIPDTRGAASLFTDSHTNAGLG